MALCLSAMQDLDMCVTFTDLSLFTLITLILVLILKKKKKKVILISIKKCGNNWPREKYSKKVHRLVLHNFTMH